MKSGKQKRVELKARRHARLRVLRDRRLSQPDGRMPSGAVAADPAQLAHNFFCYQPPSFYLDRPFVCRDCGAREVWTAQQQKWWYEIVKGRIDSIAVRCRPCRLRERARVEEARRVSQAGMAKKILDKKKNGNA